MKKAILLALCLFIFSSFAHAQTSHYYEVKLRYDKGSISYDYVKVKPVLNERDLQNIEGGYIAEVMSFDDKVLNLTFFDIPATIIYDSFDPETGEAIGGYIEELNESEVTIKVPYFENAKEINIYDKDINKKLTIDVSDYSKIKAIKAVKENLQKQETERRMPEIKSEAKPYYLTYLLVLLFAIVLLAIVYLYKRIKN